MNALLRKEIRDAVRWLPMGLALFGLLLAYVCQRIYPPGLSSQLFMVTWFTALLYGSLLSLVTFLPDERLAARAFLIHRGIEPNAIFRTRVLVGLLVYALGMLIPLALLAAYLAAIGPERLPVSPWQVVPAVAMVVAGSSFYFAGIVIACRPANWFGTRLLPLATAVGGSFLSISVLAGGSLYMRLPLYALSCASALLMALAARHAFVWIPSQVHPTRVCSVSQSMRLILLSASILFVSALGLLPLVSLNPTISTRYPSTEFDKDGMPIYVVRGPGVFRTGSGEILESIPIVDPSEPKPQQIEISNFGTPFFMGQLMVPTNEFDPTFVQQFGDRSVYFDPSGYLLVYNVNQVFGTVLESVIASDAVSRPNEPRGKPIQSTPRSLMHGSFYPGVNNRSESFELPAPPYPSNTDWAFVTSDGIFKADLANRTVEPLLKESIDSFGAASTGGLEKVAIQSRDSLRIYKTDVSERGVLPSRFTLEATLQGTFKPNAFLCYRDSKNWTYLDGYASFDFNVTRSMDGKTRQYNFVLPDETAKLLNTGRREWPMVLGVLPPVITTVSLLIAQAGTNFNTINLSTIDYLPLLIQLFVAIALTIVATRHRGLSSRQTAIWVMLAGLLGLGIPLAIIAIYPAAVYETCGACHRRRRVENATCEHCGAAWEALPPEGIEILESRTVETLSTIGQA